MTEKPISQPTLSAHTIQHHHELGNVQLMESLNLLLLPVYK
jgi:hypothetical protein